MVTVSSKNWSVGGMSGTDIDGHVFQPFRIINNKIHEGSQYGRKFETSEEMWAFALLYGYLEEHFRRSWCGTCKKVHSYLDRDCPDRFKN